MKAGASHSGDINSDVMGEGSRVRVENDQTLTYEGEREWIRKVMAGDVLADMIDFHQPVGRFVGAGLIQSSYHDFFRFEWMAFTCTLLTGNLLSPSICDAYKTVCLTEAICQSLRDGGVPTPVAYELRSR